MLGFMRNCGEIRVTESWDDSGRYREIIDKLQSTREECKDWSQM